MKLPEVGSQERQLDLHTKGKFAQFGVNADQVHVKVATYKLRSDSCVVIDLLAGYVCLLCMRASLKYLSAS